jgi:hypothetical protein
MMRGFGVDGWRDVWMTTTTTLTLFVDLTGPRTEKALEAPQCALFMDVGQIERDIRAYTRLPSS